jgi:hypothetical protein
MCLRRFLDDNLEDLTRQLLKAPFDSKTPVYTWLIVDEQGKLFFLVIMTLMRT